MSLRQSGINPLGYLGVEPVTVAADVSYPRDPTPNDSQNFQIMTRWLNTTNMTYWVLVSLAANVATWIELAASGVGSVLTITGDAGGPVGPDGSGNINFAGAPNLPNSGAVFTGNPATHDFLLSFNLFNMQNATSGGEGIYYYNNTAFISNFGTNNIFLGANAGNVTLSTAAGNIGIGLISLDALTTGQDNVCVGNLGQSALTTGSNNTSIGFGTLFGLISGSNNITVGFNAGVNYVAAESSNILIGNTGTAAESNVIRIGTSGQQNTAYMAGIYNVTPSGSPIPVVINSNGQLGTGGGTGFEQIVVQVFTTSGTYTPTAGMQYCTIEALGGGGGGGGGATSGAAECAIGGGGGGGGYGRITVNAATIGASQTVTIGGGGAGGSADGVTNSGAGGTTSVGAIISATGGNGGIYGTNAGGAVTAAITGGIGSVSSDVYIQGGYSLCGVCTPVAGTFYGFSGSGGATYFGAGAFAQPISGTTSLTGVIAPVWGGGGGGAAVSNGVQRSGGAGRQGLVVITEYIN